MPSRHSRSRQATAEPASHGPSASSHETRATRSGAARALVAKVVTAASTAAIAQAHLILLINPPSPGQLWRLVGCPLDVARARRMMLAVSALLAAAALLTSADQASKALTGRLLVDGCFRPVGWRSGFTRVLNPRAGFVAVPLGWAVILWMAALALGGLVAVHGSPLGIAGAVGLGLALGGATSNLADRVLRGAVVDFIAVGPWPTFNLADAGMVAGVVLLAVSLA
jgi:lipoprotein signal peptidase